MDIMGTHKYKELDQDQDSDDTTKPSCSNHDISDQLDSEIQRVKSLQRQNTIQWILLGIVSFIAVGALNVILQDQRIKIPNLIYSPAQPLVKYKTVTFNSGFGKETTPYSGYPNDENNKAWEDLYNYGIVKIPRSDAVKLVNHTMPLSTDPNYYVVGIDVFHQLHCLSHLRKVAWGVDMGVDMKNLTEKETFYTHVDHCINSLRQSLMCSSDISTIHWSWVEKDQVYEPDGRTVHTCRDFEAIRDWAFENWAGAFDSHIHLADPLLD